MVGDPPGADAGPPTTPFVLVTPATVCVDASPGVLAVRASAPLVTELMTAGMVGWCARGGFEVGGAACVVAAESDGVA